METIDLIEVDDETRRVGNVAQHADDQTRRAGNEAAPVGVGTSDAGREGCIDGDGRPLEIFEKMRQRFQFLEDEFFKLKSAKAKKGKSDIALEFKCVKCGSNQSLSTTSFSNLRRHVERKHPPVFKQYVKLWENNKRKADEEEMAAKKRKLQTNMHNFFSGKSAPTVDPIVTQQRLDDTILEFVVATNQAYRIVEHPKFKSLALLGN